MHLLPHNKKHILFKIAAFIFLVLMLSFGNCYSQSVEPLPDSVKAEEDVVENITDTVETSSPKTDIIRPADTIVIRNVPDSTVDALKKRKDFAYANDEAYWRKEPEKKREKGFWDYIFEFAGSIAGKIFFYALIGGVLLFALYKIIVDNKLYMFYSKPKKRGEAQEDENDISAEDIDEKIKEALQAHDHRLAIRYMHLKALHLLNDKGLIHFNAQATNYEYSLQLGATSVVGREFRFLTNIYEHVWYGGFDITQQQTETITQHFNQFYSSIKN